MGEWESGMSEWQPIKTAPKDGTWIQADIPNNGSDNVVAWLPGLLNDKVEDCGGWQFVTEQEPPPCWTDGVCWESNEDRQPSIKPTRWKCLPLEDIKPWIDADDYYTGDDV